MKNNRFKIIVFSFSFIALTSGFFLSYFQEPTREEKVLRALNYDLRFTEKVAQNNLKRKPTSEALKKHHNKSPLTFGKNIESDHSFTMRQYEIFKNATREQINDQWETISGITVVKNPESQDVPYSLDNFRGYYFFKEKDIDTKNYNNKSLMKLVLNKKTKMLGFLTGSINIQLKKEVDANNFWQEFDVSLVSFFENSNIIIVTPERPEDLKGIYLLMKKDIRVERVEPEVLFRFVDKR